MKKKWITALVVMVMAVTQAMGQMVFLDEDVNHQRKARDGEELGVMIPLQNQPYDQFEYSPLGEGLLMLLGMGGAYLLAKRKKQE